MSVNNTNKVLKALKNGNNTSTIDVYGVQLEVRHSITVNEMCQFVFDYVTNIIRDVGDGDLVYIAPLEGLSFRAQVLKYYANFKIDSLSVDDLYAVCNSDIFDNIVSCVDVIQLDQLHAAVVSQLDHEIKKLENKSKFDSVGDALISVIEKAGENLDNVEDITKIAKMLSETDESSLAKAILKLQKD